MYRFLAPVAALAAAAALATPAAAALVVDSDSIGAAVVVATSGNVIARYEGADTGLISELYLWSPQGQFDNLIFSNDGSFPVGAEVDLGAYDAGIELIFKLVTSQGDVFYSGSFLRNPDGAYHAAASTDGGRTYVGFEDLSAQNGATIDGDYNDLVFSFSNTRSVADPGGVPEPSTWALMIAGFGGAGAMLRRKRQLAAA